MKAATSDGGFMLFAAAVGRRQGYGGLGDLRHYAASCMASSTRTGVLSDGLGYVRGYLQGQLDLPVGGGVGNRPLQVDDDAGRGRRRDDGGLHRTRVGAGGSLADDGSLGRLGQTN